MEQTMRSIIRLGAPFTPATAARQTRADTLAVPTGRVIEASALRPLLFTSIVEWRLAASAVGRCPR
jgi:hypothetical protein